MSDRDKKLLIYLGALVILAAAYFLVGKPYLDKIEAITTENNFLEAEVIRKRGISDKEEEYKNKTAEANEKIDKILSKFPEDNSDENSIMFVANMEKDIPIWINNIKFAESDSNPIAGETEEANPEEPVVTEEVVEPDIVVEDTVSEENDAEDEEIPIQNYYGRNTEMAISFTSNYETFKQLLSYIKDYENRIVIKEIDVTYDPSIAMNMGNIVLSQYAILADNRKLEKPETGIEEEQLGTKNIFSSSSPRKSIINTILDEIAKLTGDGAIPEDLGDTIDGADYFVKVSAATDNSDGITIGRQGDIPGESYITNSDNAKKKVSFIVSGSDGDYSVVYKVGDEKKSGALEKSADDTIVLDIRSSERLNDDDKTSVEFHITNKSDLPLIVNVSGDDSESKRVKIVESNGDVTVNE